MIPVAQNLYPANAPAKLTLVVIYKTDNPVTPLCLFYIRYDMLGTTACPYDKQVYPFSLAAAPTAPVSQDAQYPGQCPRRNCAKYDKDTSQKGFAGRQEQIRKQNTAQHQKQHGKRARIDTLQIIPQSSIFPDAFVAVQHK